MKKFLSIHILIAMAVVFASCGTGNDVVSNRLISKRKHTKGFFINKNGNNKASKAKKEEQSIAFDDTKKERKPYTKKLKANKTQSNRGGEILAQNESPEIANENTSSWETFERVKRGGDYLSDNAGFDSEDHEDEVTELPTNRESQNSQKKEVKSAEKKNNSNRSGGADGMTILLVIIALFIAPLAVGIYEGITTRFWITLALWLIGIGVGFWLFGGALAWLAGLIAAIYAILIVIGAI